ncbi:Uncharacterized protein TCM_009280 [Theobroma cacao]|uniref:Uncharacterized protein n=1 Tax=Theobroma cacao TaxID=3641 RepID=A0A061E4Q0_THECC|nr:Uncharacterized protein TCM_009280 [Theobroma cacao]
MMPLSQFCLFTRLETQESAIAKPCLFLFVHSFTRIYKRTIRRHATTTTNHRFLCVFGRRQLILGGRRQSSLI